MGLILFILKIILIAVAIVLGIIFLILGMVLLIPIRYEVSGSVGDSFELCIKGKVTYLFSIVKALFLYEEKAFSMKLFFFGFEKKEKKDENIDKNIKENAEENVEEMTESAEDDAEIFMHEKTKPPESQEIVEEAKEDEASEIVEEAEESGTSKGLEETETPKLQTEQESQKTESDNEEANTGGESKKKRFKSKKIKKEKSQQKEKKFDFAFIKQQLMDEHNHSVVRKIFAELGYLIRHFKFRKIVTDLTFSTSDPASTGQALGVLCMIPALYRYDFKIVPDFEAEKAYVKGTFLIAGKVRIVHILIVFLRLIFDKEVRLVVKRILNIVRQ